MTKKVIKTSTISDRGIGGESWEEIVNFYMKFGGATEFSKRMAYYRKRIIAVSVGTANDPTTLAVKELLEILDEMLNYFEKS